ncbi:hypothetical protein WN943_019996 [Citrus x changshan-huyou]
MIFFKLSEVQVYSLASGSWKRKNRDMPHLNFNKRHGVYASGALHWLGRYNNDCRNKVVAFGLALEDYEEVLLPLPLFHQLVGTNATQRSDKQQLQVQLWTWDYTALSEYQLTECGSHSS